MKFLLFSDLHYDPIEYMGGTWEDLALLQRRAEETGCEMIIHAGDFCHGPAETEDVMAFTKAYNDFHIPSYHCLGNHDTDRTPLKDVLRLYNMPGEYYFFDQGGYRFVILNPNYYRDGDKYIAYDLGNYYSNGSKRDWLPPEQLAWLKETVASSPFPCILISHESFERCDGVQNRDDVIAVIREANARKPHSVLMCINGHYHCDYMRVWDGVLYYDFVSASFDALGTPHPYFPEEETKRMRWHHTTVVFNDCLHAIVTLDGTKITVEGMESSFYMGVTREMVVGTRYGAGREVFPRVQSASITL